MKDGFVPGPGRAGAGVYFWAYEKNVDLARKLAIGWFTYCTKRGSFSKSKDARCAVLYGQYEADDEEYFDCSGLAFQEVLLEYMKGFPEYSDTDLNLAHGKIFSELEQKSGRQLKIVLTKVAQPPKMSLVEGKAFHGQFCYVVRHDPSGIRVVKCEEVDAEAEAATA
ncbi:MULTISPECIES: hypothetical protein [unclassified Cupriavidus]|uniref:hypothetical protein n=1 Tax=unclassified Cupriavidus TaxID=2640874 RepID=UPI00313DAEC5